MANFDLAFRFMAPHEWNQRRNFTNDPHDPGGPTKWGITLKSWQFQGSLGDLDGDGDVDVDADPVAPSAGTTPVAVQLCLCVVAEARDASTGDQLVRACGNRPAWIATDRRPRLVVSRTVAIRNAGP